MRIEPYDSWFEMPTQEPEETLEQRKERESDIEDYFFSLDHQVNY